MKTLCNVLILITIFLFGGCSLFSKRSPAVPLINKRLVNYILADSFIREENEITSACILSDSADIYERDSIGALVKTSVLFMGDTLGVNNQALSPFMNIYYSFQLHGRKAFIYGPNLGYKTNDVDFDGDGRPDEIICGYTDYDTSSFGEGGQGLHPLRIRFISANNKKYELRDSGYSAILVEEIKDSMATLFSKPTKLFDINTGYPACGYQQIHILVALRADKFEVIHKYVAYMDGDYGNFFETVLPTSEHNHPDTIFLLEKTSAPLSDTSDSTITLPKDTSIIYLKGEKWITKTLWTRPVDPAWD